MPQRAEYHYNILYAVFPGASLATLDQIQRSRNIPPSMSHSSMLLQKQ